ncbi:MAG: helix-turn-helix domain-containing protein [Hyphomicrobiaceae bacterium]
MGGTFHGDCPGCPRTCALVEGGELPESTELDFQIGKRLERRRAILGIDQAELALAASISIDQLQRFETGDERPSAKTLLKLCQLLDIKLGELLRDLADKSSFSDRRCDAVVIDFSTRRPRH